MCFMCDGEGEITIDAIRGKHGDCYFCHGTGKVLLPKDLNSSDIFK